MLAVRAALGAVVALWAVASLPAVAHADPAEELVQIAHHPTDPDTLLVRYRNGGGGLWLTHDGGKHFQLIPYSFIDPTGSTRETVAAVAHDGTLWLGSSGGTFRSDPDGCSFAPDEQIGQRWVRDFATDPSDPHVLYALAGDVGEDAENGLLVRDADGEWSELGTQEKLLPYGLRVVSTGEGLRFVVTARKDERGLAADGTPTVEISFVLRVSEDRGASWQEFPFTTLDAPKIEAIDPEHPDHMLLYVNGVDDDRLLVSLDGGRSVQPWLRLSDWSGVAILPGGRVLIGDRGLLTTKFPGRLWSAANLASTPEPLGDWQVRCIDYDAPTDTLLGCELRGLGTIDRDSGEFAVLARWTDTLALDCPGVDVARASQVQLCRGFCLNHFPQAPVCAAYQLPTCGPCGTTPPSPGCKGYPAPADARAPDAAVIAAADAGDERDRDASSGDAGTLTRASVGGCGCAALGRAHGAHTRGLTGGALVLALGAGRRVRGRKPG